MAVGSPSRTVDAAASPAATSVVRAWLYALVLLVIAMVVVGGATRLTGSGLSITEWKPVTGAIPPLSETMWSVEFEKYRQSPQYALLNRGMSLPEFKTIYWWEWTHRQLGRFLGLAFALPFLWFWLKGRIGSRLALTLLGIGALGALQGAVGWIMVASGLEPGMTAVAPIKLTLHLTIASLILAWLLWVALGLPASSTDRPGSAAASGGRGVGRAVSPDGGTRVPLLLLGLVLLQIALGGLVAGSKAGLTYNTWPLMDGRLVPPLDGLFALTPWPRNVVENVALVQFNHRMMAYLLVALAIGNAVAVAKAAPGSAAARRAAALAALVLAQMTLGIVTLLLAVPLWAGLAHQLLAMVVLVVVVAHARLDAPMHLRPRPARARIEGR
jgi:cytochrome c oxidase assembly protein subunit 15